MKCKSKRIKTRINKSFGKSVTTVIGCKDCGSTAVERQEERRDSRRGRR
jgi:hypothetical protein